jgi:hypothetical protein
VFKYEGNQFKNWSNKKVLDVYQGRDAEGQAAIVWKKHGGANQRWKVVYLDTDKGPQKKGLNKEFGFHCNRPFYISSRLPMHRVAEMLGGTNVTLKRWVKNRKAQQWFFDCTSKLVRNNYWKNYCLNIPSNGKANQRWKVVYLDKDDGPQKKGLNKEFGFHCNRPFYISSRLPMHRVAEMLGGT